VRFIDECELRVEAGDGGNGCAAFRREKSVPFGGPAGGDGGRGGNIVLVAREGLGTLHDLTHQRVVRAVHGQHGMGSDCYGRAGRDEELFVPVGTVVFDGDSGEKIGELLQHADRLIVAKGGAGGRGNKHFATSVDRAPRRKDPGEPGEKRELRLELKVMADVGLLGFPNVGKSTFLKHLERTRVLLHLITVAADEPGRDPLTDYDVIRAELANFDPALAERPEIVAMTKADLPEVQAAYPALKDEFAKRGITLHLVSAVTHQDLDPLLYLLADTLAAQKS